jgi:hypothetical protein
MFNNTTTTSLKKTPKMPCKRTYPSPPRIYSKPLNQNTDPNRKRRRRRSGSQKKLAQPKTEQASFLCFRTSPGKRKRKRKRESASPPRLNPFPQLRHCSPILSSTTTTTTPKIRSCENERRHNNRTLLLPSQPNQKKPKQNREKGMQGKENLRQQQQLHEHRQQQPRLWIFWGEILAAREIKWEKKMVQRTATQQLL